jgi:hypothetical protein
MQNYLTPMEKILCSPIEREELLSIVPNVKSTLHDLEEDDDPTYYHTLHGISGSTLETSRYDREEDLEYAGYMGMKVCPVDVIGGTK